tara:strand:- start:380 stop:862 length:483 start_codon:yes stop_codon:yes gene_type:complete
MFLNFILPTTFIFSWVIYVFKNDPDEIIFYSVFLLFPYLILVTKIRGIRVMKKLSPLETLITHGSIEGGLNPIFAIVAERNKGSYKLYFNGNKKSQSIVSVQSFLSKNTKQSRDRAFYIQIQLEKKLISYAPHKGATLWGQEEYAQNILDDMIANGVETH